MKFWNVGTQKTWVKGFPSKFKMYSGTVLGATVATNALATGFMDTSLGACVTHSAENKEPPENC